jgi:hypothetical protein
MLLGVFGPDMLYRTLATLAMGTSRSIRSKRWSAQRTTDLVMRLVRGEALASVDTQNRP